MICEIIRFTTWAVVEEKQSWYADGPDVGRCLISPAVD